MCYWYTDSVGDIQAYGSRIKRLNMHQLFLLSRYQLLVGSWRMFNHLTSLQVSTFNMHFQHQEDITPDEYGNMEDALVKYPHIKDTR